LIWWITSDKRLSAKAKMLIRSRRNSLFWSVASTWEISIKHGLGRLSFDYPPEKLLPKELEKNAVNTLTIEHEHAFLAGSLPMYHKDPFDRMLIAQSKIESLGVISNDKALTLYDIDTFW
jgi:PIN domain nuclease of toxin-antitoxin system